MIDHFWTAVFLHHFCFRIVTALKCCTLETPVLQEHSQTSFFLTRCFLKTHLMIEYSLRSLELNCPTPHTNIPISTQYQLQYLPDMHFPRHFAISKPNLWHLNFKITLHTLSNMLSTAHQRTRSYTSLSSMLVYLRMWSFSTSGRERNASFVWA